MNTHLMRTVDANINRITEGLRVLEDISRFTLNDKASSVKIKKIRHKLVGTAIKYGIDLLDQRNVVLDFGSRTAELASRPDLASVVSANSRRIQEGLRVLEELSKLPGMKATSRPDTYKKMRFDVYQIERHLVSRILRLDKSGRIKGLYVILDTRYISQEKIVDAALQTINGGARIIQLRDKSTMKNDLLSIAKDLKQICLSHSVIFIVNDYLDIALAADADGVHLGQDDLPVKEARRFLPIDKIIGCSVVNLKQVKQAQNDGADYVAVGAVYSTPTKEDVITVGLDMLCKIRRAVDLPIVAIGGINKQNLKKVFSSGADAVAVISAIFAHNEVEKYTEELVFKISKIQKN